MTAAFQGPGPIFGRLFRSSMIQRKQTLFLLLAALLVLSTWLFPIASYQSTAEIYELMTYGLYTADGIKVKDADL